MIVVTAEMSQRPRHDVIGSNDGRGPSQLDIKMRNVLDATQALEVVASHLVKALVNVQGEGTRSGRKGCSFKEFYEHPFHMFKGNLNSGKPRKWLTIASALVSVESHNEKI